uniref:Uncharacterized protein n=1 Tax=uncultured Rhodospirillales bacterium HF4000_24M03 TaxID=710788 RepID=E0XW11_9PROT|nr:hypothetical protein [uncultured Rhodospirillales bacterium HF4000_24M03]
MFVTGRAAGGLVGPSCGPIWKDDGAPKTGSGHSKFLAAPASKRGPMRGWAIDGHGKIYRTRARLRRGGAIAGTALQPPAIHAAACAQGFTRR